MPANGIDRATWERINALFHDALERPRADRASFLDTASDDERIKKEVRSLLAAHERTSEFMDVPAATMPLQSGALAPPARIGGYEIRGVLGEGGMGVVYLAEDVRLGRMVALKAVSPRHLGDPARRARLRREARAAASLHHPGIATVFALEEIGDHLYIAGEYVTGETLRDELGRGPLEPLRAVDTALAVARALAVAHEAGIVHRDLKPENLMRTPAGEVKILDFGLARFDDASGDSALSGDSAVLGTPAYMSPEQIRGGVTDARSDLFSLGVVLYELVTGVRPFGGTDAASTIARILESEPDRLGARTLESLSPVAQRVLDRVMMTCLRKRAADRFPSARHLIAALEDARAAITAGAASAPHRHDVLAPLAPPDAVWWWRFHQIAATIGYALLVVPLWRVRDLSDDLGTLLFVLGLAGATGGGAVRLHLWFVSRVDRSSFHEHHRRAWPWRLVSDGLMTLVLATEGVIALLARENWGMLLVAAAVAVLVSFALVEPATTRAAFGPDETGVG